MSEEGKQLDDQRNQPFPNPYMMGYPNQPYYQPPPMQGYPPPKYFPNPYDRYQRAPYADPYYDVSNLFTHNIIKISKMWTCKYSMRMDFIKGFEQDETQLNQVNIGTCHPF